MNIYYNLKVILSNFSNCIQIPTLLNWHRKAPHDCTSCLFIFTATTNQILVYLVSWSQMPNASRFNYIQFKRYLNEKAKKKADQIRFWKAIFTSFFLLLALILNCKRTKRKQTRAEMQQSNIKFLVGDYITRRAFFLIFNSSREKVKHQDLLLFFVLFTTTPWI